MKTKLISPTSGIINGKLLSKEELQKCKDLPVYFYNKYVRKEGLKELTEVEYEDFVKQVECEKHIPSNVGKHYNDIPLLPSECYEKLP